MNYLDWDEEVLMEFPCEKNISTVIDFKEARDDVHQFIHYQHSFLQFNDGLQFYGNNGYGASINAGDWK